MKKLEHFFSSNFRDMGKVIPGDFGKRENVVLRTNRKKAS